MMLNEQISFGGRRVAGFHLVGVGQEPTFTVQVDFSSDQPVTPQQFFALVDAVQQELIPAETTVSFMPLTESTFRGVFKIRQSYLPVGTQLTDLIPVGDDAEIQGVSFTITGVEVLDAPAPAPGAPTLMFLPGSTWTINFVSDKPTTPEQFFEFAAEVGQWVPAKVVGSVPIDTARFAITIEPTEAIDPGAVTGQSIELEGIRFTATGAYSGPYRADAPQPAIPTPLPTLPPVIPIPPPTVPPAPVPAPVPVPVPTPAPVPEPEEKKKISTAAIVGIGVAVVAVGGGVIYVATRKKKRQRKAT